MIEKRILLPFAVIPYLLFSILFISCSKENKETGSKNDSVKTEISGAPIKSDTADFKTEKDTVVKENFSRVKDTATVKEKKEKVRVIAYYFHPTARCPSCINIENFTEEVINTQFTKETGAGLLSFRQLNIEDSVNEHYIDDYKLEFSSVILAKYVNNKQVKWKNLENVWKYSNDKESFFKYMKIEVKEFLKEKKEAL